MNCLEVNSKARSDCDEQTKATSEDEVLDPGRTLQDTQRAAFQGSEDVFENTTAPGTDRETSEQPCSTTQETQLASNECKERLKGWVGEPEETVRDSTLGSETTYGVYSLIRDTECTERGVAVDSTIGKDAIGRLETLDNEPAEVMQASKASEKRQEMHAEDDVLGTTIKAARKDKIKAMNSSSGLTGDSAQRQSTDARELFSEANEANKVEVDWEQTPNEFPSEPACDMPSEREIARFGSSEPFSEYPMERERVDVTAEELIESFDIAAEWGHLQKVKDESLIDRAQRIMMEMNLPAMEINNFRNEAVNAPAEVRKAAAEPSDALSDSSELPAYKTKLLKETVPPGAVRLMTEMNERPPGVEIGVKREAPEGLVKTTGQTLVGRTMEVGETVTALTGTRTEQYPMLDLSKAGVWNSLSVATSREDLDGVVPLNLEYTAASKTDITKNLIPVLSEQSTGYSPGSDSGIGEDSVKSVKELLKEKDRQLHESDKNNSSARKTKEGSKPEESRHKPDVSSTLPSETPISDPHAQLDPGNGHAPPRTSPETGSTVKKLTQRLEARAAQLRSAETFADISRSERMSKCIYRAMAPYEPSHRYTYLEQGPKYPPTSLAIKSYGVDTNPSGSRQGSVGSIADEELPSQAQGTGGNRPQPEPDGDEAVTKEEMERYTKIARDLKLRRGSLLPPSGTLQSSENVPVTKKKPNSPSTLSMETSIKLYGRGRVTFAFDANTEGGGAGGAGGGGGIGAISGSGGGSVQLDDSQTNMAYRGAPSTSHTPRRMSIDVRAPAATPAISTDSLKRMSVDFKGANHDDSMQYEPLAPPDTLRQATKKRHSEHAKGQPAEDLQKKHSEPATLPSGNKQATEADIAARPPGGSPTTAMIERSASSGAETEAE